jgi:hypothetical protein
MRNPSPVPAAPARESREARTQDQGSVPAQVAVAENSAPGPRADSPAEAQGRRTLSTAFVRVGSDGHLTVELRDGRVIVLRDVAMRPRDYCGVQALGSAAGTRYCGGYGDVAAARPGGAPAPEGPSPATLNPAEPGHGPAAPE